MDWVTIIGYLITPVTGIIGWLAGTRMRRNTALQSLRDTIQMQAETIKEYNDQILQLMEQVQKLRSENAELKEGQNRLIVQLEDIKKENKELKELVQAKKSNKK